ncbi:UNVERIFIED_CONTAM: hypothetical protein K2H54_044154 [Gekko kuhli]
MLTRYDFFIAMQNIEHKIAEQVQEAVQQAIKPLSDELKTIIETLSEVSQAAEMVLEGAITTHQDIRQLQQSESWARTKIMAIHIRLNYSRGN